eukprot:213454-Chlamydomonas_euryale.AAC.2
MHTVHVASAGVIASTCGGVDLPHQATRIVQVWGCRSMGAWERGPSTPIHPHARVHERSL